MFTAAIFYWDMRRREKARGGDKLSDDKLCLALDTRGGIFRPSSAPSPPSMWEWSSPICSDEMPNFWKVNILQTNTINIWPTGSLLASGREMGAIREEKRGEARRGREIITPRWKQSWGEKQTLTRGDNDDNFLWGKSQDSGAKDWAVTRLQTSLMTRRKMRAVILCHRAAGSGG